MAEDTAPSEYPQLPPDPVSGSWLARNRRLVILGGTVLVLILLILIYPRLRARVGTNTNSTGSNTNSATNSTSTTTNRSLPSTFRRYTITTVPDQDRDGLSDAEEERLGTNPAQADTDGDGLSDYDEVKIYHSDPRKPDTDGDGVSDGREVHQGTNPAGPGTLYDLSRALQQAQTK